jgi:succinate dehydrogenase hydrophobic anchor subunit
MCILLSLVMLAALQFMNTGLGQWSTDYSKNELPSNVIKFMLHLNAGGCLFQWYTITVFL